MRGVATILVLVGCVICATAALAAPLEDRITAVAADGSVQLASGGKAVLADLIYPDPALAERVLARAMLQQTISYTAGMDDRYGRTRIAGAMQETMLREGAAVLFPTDTPPDAWRAAEAAARAAKRGVWAQEGLVITPEEAAQHIGEFHVVEGTIARLYTNKTATYVNFGADWHTDFSVTITGRVRRGMEKLALKEGDRVAVRGMIYEENGPMIRLSHPAQWEKR